MATTIADGSYSLLISGGKLPCLLQITNPLDGTKLHTVATGSSAAVTANITPLTEMLVARLLLNDPAVLFAAFDAAVTANTVTTAAVAAAQTDVTTVLVGTVNTSSLTDFIKTPLKAATQSNLTGGDSQDQLLDALRMKLSPAQLTQVVTALAKTVSTADIKQVVANLTAIPPVANAGADQNVVVGTVVTLDGSSSNVDVARTLTFTWVLTSKPTGSTATLVSPTSPKPTLLVDLPGTYVASVIVNDGLLNSSADAVSVAASVANAAPVANAGVTQNIIAGSVVTLDGSASSDANGDPLTYTWTLTSRPIGSAAVLSSSTSAGAAGPSDPSSPSTSIPSTGSVSTSSSSTLVKPTFTADFTGSYVANLIVNDGKLNSAAATVSITAAVLNVAPIANAGVAQNVAVGNVVTLDGSASSDANGDPLTYTWALTSRPTGSAAILSSSTSAKPTFTADVGFTYVASITVNDGKLNSTSATVSITATTPIFSANCASCHATTVAKAHIDINGGFLRGPCAICHGAGKALNHHFYSMNPATRAVCGSCHSGIDFATGTGTTILGIYTGHVGGAFLDDTTCSVCHDTTRNTATHSWIK